MASRATTHPPIRFYNFAPTTASCQEKIVRGLRQAEKELPATLLYDARGLRLFDRISRIDGYSAARRESKLLRRRGAELRALAGKRSVVIDYGSGTSRGAMALLRSIHRPAAYLPVDVSLAALKRGAGRMRASLPDIRVMPIRADFTCCFPLPVCGPRPARSIVYVSSATFSSLEATVATRLLQGAEKLCGQRGGVLLGVDLRTDAPGYPPSIDEHELLRAFNLNALANLNRQFDAAFRPERFSHQSVFNPVRRRVELRLVSRVGQAVKIDAQRFRLRPGEAIRTECSHRYGWQEIERLAGDAGLKIEHAWFDDERRIALAHLRSAAG